MDRIHIINGKILTPFRSIENGSILVENGNIAYVGSDDINQDDCIIIDADNNYVSPGFIDIHSHGGGG